MCQTCGTAKCCCHKTISKTGKRGPIGPRGLPGINGISYIPNYKVYSVLLTQSGVNPPVATILENTLIGTPIWTYDGVGSYTMTLAGAFPAAKTAIQPMTNKYNVSSLNDVMQVFGASRNDNDSIGVYVGLSDVAGNRNSANNELYNTFFEIRVYN